MFLKVKKMLKYDYKKYINYYVKLIKTLNYFKKFSKIPRKVKNGNTITKIL